MAKMMGNDPERYESDGIAERHGVRDHQRARAKRQGHIDRPWVCQANTTHGAKPKVIQ